jgi:hypothetical protein
VAMKERRRFNLLLDLTLLKIFQALVDPFILEVINECSEQIHQNRHVSDCEILPNEQRAGVVIEHSSQSERYVGNGEKDECE